MGCKAPSTYCFIVAALERRSGAVYHLGSDGVTALLAIPMMFMVTDKYASQNLERRFGLRFYSVDNYTISNSGSSRYHPIISISFLSH